MHAKHTSTAVQGFRKLGSAVGDCKNSSSGLVYRLENTKFILYLVDVVACDMYETHMPHSAGFSNIEETKNPPNILYSLHNLRIMSHKAMIYCK